MADAPVFWFDAVSKAVTPLEARITRLEGQVQALQSKTTVAAPPPATVAPTQSTQGNWIVGAATIAIVVVAWWVWHKRSQKGNLPMSANTDKVDAATGELKESLQKAATAFGVVVQENADLKKANADLTAKLQEAAADDAKLATTAENIGALKSVADGLVAPAG